MVEARRLARRLERRRRGATRRMRSASWTARHPSWRSVPSRTLAIFVTLVARWALRLRISPLIPGLVIGGMVGNILDRIVLGSVRDFLVTPWVICNVADLAIVGGLVVFVVAFGLRLPQTREMTAATSLYARTRS